MFFFFLIFKPKENPKECATEYVTLCKFFFNFQQLFETVLIVFEIVVVYYLLQYLIKKQFIFFFFQKLSAYILMGHAIIWQNLFNLKSHVPYIKRYNAVELGSSVHM